MANQGIIILLAPLMGLISICRNGKWTWNVVKSSKLCTYLFWFGWFSGLIVGILTVFNVI
ncbi:MAG: hypothetical protein COA79_21545 [Planctomycetota bacterium]|nr:MAG: hypothetical protein COA79_21545 [Planctomycetota bacterium]